MDAQRDYREIYGGRAPQDAPGYTIPDAARYLHIPRSTLRWWVLGGRYKTEAGAVFASPVIELADEPGRLLSFRNLVEAHVIDALRQRHNIRLPEVRRAVDYMKDKLSIDHPLASPKMVTDGKYLFVREYGSLINVSAEGQQGLLEVLESRLRRIEWNKGGALVALYPIARLRESTTFADEPKIIIIDPLVGFGRPTLASTGIRTSIIHERFLAGDSIAELTEDYSVPTEEIEEAIRYEDSIHSYESAKAA